MKIKLSFSKGFTIMEMLIVIVIIGLLATTVTVVYIGVRATARDTQRFDDISTIIKAVDSYIAYNNTIPGSGDSTGAHLAEVCPSDLKNDLKGAGLLNKMPTDPLDSLAAQGTCDRATISNHGSNIEDTYYFYGWDSAHMCSVANCVSINRTETDKLKSDLLARFTDMNMAICGGNVNIGTGNDFDYCFTDNRTP